MRSKLRITLVLACGILCSIAPYGWAANDMARPLPRATVMSPADTTTTYHIRDMHGQMLTVEVPPLGSPHLKVSDPVRGTVATVMAVDGQTNQAQVRTQEGQILVLNLPPETVMGMRVGDQFTLSIAQQSMQ